MEDLKRAKRDDFVENLSNRLKITFPEKNSEMSNEEFDEIVDHGVDRAADYQLNEDVSIERFVEYLFRYSEEFALDPSTSWANEILNDDRLTPTEKLNEVDRNWINKKL